EPRTAALEIDDDGVVRARAGVGSVGHRDAGVGDEAGQREDDRKGMHGGGVYARFARPARPVFTASRKPVGDAGAFALETITVTEPIRRNAAMDHLSIAEAGPSVEIVARGREGAVQALRAVLARR